MLDRQARVAEDSGNYYPSIWVSFGNVTHVEAAEKLGYCYVRSPMVIETRCSDTPDTIFKHRVTNSLKLDVVPLRGDESE